MRSQQRFTSEYNCEVFEPVRSSCVINYKYFQGRPLRFCYYKLWQCEPCPLKVQDVLCMYSVWNVLWGSNGSWFINVCLPTLQCLAVPQPGGRGRSRAFVSRWWATSTIPNSMSILHVVAALLHVFTCLSNCGTCLQARHCLWRSRGVGICGWLQSNCELDVRVICETTGLGILVIKYILWWRNIYALFFVRVFHFLLLTFFFWLSYSIFYTVSQSSLPSSPTLHLSPFSFPLIPPLSPSLPPTLHCHLPLTFSLSPSSPPYWLHPLHYHHSSPAPSPMKIVLNLFSIYWLLTPWKSRPAS